MNSFCRLSILLALVISVSSCKTTSVSRKNIPSDSLHGLLAAHSLYMPGDVHDTAYHHLSDKQAVADFYNFRKHQPVWVVDNQATPLSDTLMQVLSDARYYGLSPQFYHKDEITKFTALKSAKEIIRRDALLTDAFLSFLTDIQFGRTRSVSSQESIPQLVHVLAHGNLQNVIQSNEPDYTQYHLLKNELKSLIDSTAKQKASAEISTHSAVKSIEINLERWRNETESEQDIYLLVNIPSFLLQVYERDTIRFESKTIVGTRDTPTPLVSSTIECLVTYPYWNVPRKISVEEFLPQIRKDTSFISRNHFDLIDRKGKLLNSDSIDWSKMSKNFFPFSLRQREGPDNSLGLVKFIFDNPYAVYLHDTNAPRLFQKEYRALSHGCIRVERAIDLAHYLITRKEDKTSDELIKLLDQQQRHVMTVTDMPLYIRYFTAEVRNGELCFYKDIYNQDSELYSHFLAPNIK